MLGESLISIGKKNEGISLIKKGFIKADLSRNDLKFFRKKFKKYLSKEDYIKRADYIAWENKYLSEYLSLLKKLKCSGVELAPNIIWAEPINATKEDR